MNKKTFLLSLLLLWCMGIGAQTKNGYPVANEGAWCWFADPRATHYQSADGSINMSYIGYIDVHGAVKATQYNFNTGEKNDVLVRSYFQPDDHNNPTFLVLPDERVLIIYSRHTDEAAFYYRVSVRPGDITQLGEEKRLATANNTTYPSPFILSDDPTHWYMCWRGISWHPTIARLTLPDENGDCHFDWGPYQMVQSTGARPYAKYYSNGKDKIYMAYTTGHPDNESPNWLYFNVFNVNDKCLYDIQGKKLSTVANGKFNVNKTADYKSAYPMTVVDAPDNGIRDWVWQIALDQQERPRIAMVRINSAKSQHEYYYARWTGSKWALTDICDGGAKFHPSNTEYCYSGGEALDQQDPNIMYVSRPTQGTYGKVHEIWKVTLNDNGQKLSEEQITRNSEKNNVRPFVLPNSQGTPLRLCWMNGDYQYWIVCKSYPNGYPTGIRSDFDMSQTAIQDKAGWTLSKTIQMDASKYTGVTLWEAGDITYGIDSEAYPWIRVNGKTYRSQNRLYTSDAWQTCPATTDGKSYSSILPTWNLTITSDGQRMTIYRNGLIDQVIETSASKPEEATDECLTQANVQNLIASKALEGVTLPQRVVTDIVLPGKVNGEKVKWTSSRPDVLSEMGIYGSPQQDTEVTLTATTSHAIREWQVTVASRNIDQNVRITLPHMDATKNTASGFSTNTYVTLPEGLLEGLRSYTVLLRVNPKSLSNSPRLYDLGGGSGNSFFLRAKELSAGIKYAGGTTTMVNSTVPLVTGKEQLLAVTFEAATHTTKIYLDGVEVASGTANQNEPYMIYDLVGDARNYVGRTQWWDNASEASKNVDFVGTIHDFVLYDIALTRKEICKLQSLPFESDPFTSEFVNGDFEGAYSVYNNPRSDRAIYLPEGWTVNYSTRDENDLTALRDGDMYYGQFFAALPRPEEGGQQTLWVRQRWGDSVLDYYQNVLLPQGGYTLSAEVYANDHSTNVATVYVGDMRKSASVLNAWQQLDFHFTSDGEEPTKIGFQANHSGSEFICGVDNFRLVPDEQDAISRPTIEHTSPLLYDLSGRRTDGRRPGVYVREGKKVIF